MIVKLPFGKLMFALKENHLFIAEDFNDCAFPTELEAFNASLRLIFMAFLPTIMIGILND